MEHKYGISRFVKIYYLIAHSYAGWRSKYPALLALSLGKMFLRSQLQKKCQDMFLTDNNVIVLTGQTLAKHRNSYTVYELSGSSFMNCRG